MTSLVPKLKKEDIPVEIKNDAREKLEFGCARLVYDQPFFGVLLARLEIIEETKIDTAATDGKRIYYNPVFFAKLDVADVLGVVMHELMHIIYLHCSVERRQSRDRHRWNISADYVINGELVTMGYELPGEGLYSDEFRGKTVEQVYAMMPEDKADKLVTFDEHWDLHSRESDEMRDAIIAAAEATKDTKGKGDIPSGVRRWLDKLRKPQIPWEREFHRYVGSALSRDNYSYRRPNRRTCNEMYMDPDGLILPSLRGEKIGNVWCGVDTSGSIDVPILETFSAEMMKINSLIDEVTIATCDAAVHEVVKLYGFTDFLDKVEFKGGGGTDFRPVFDKIKELGEKPELLIYLTDGFGSFPENPPPYPVIWVLTKNGHPAPFGANIYLPQADENTNDDY